MFSEVLKIIPKVEGKDLSSMERSLNSRFGKIAKKFGSTMVSALKGGSFIGLAAGLIDKVLNPMKEVQDAIEKSLNASDDLATFAKQFNTTAGNLARLQAFGKASGLDAEGVRLLLSKFQNAVAQQALQPDKQTAVANFVGRTDTAEAFFEFIQAMQKMTDTQKNLVQQEVFGEKQILKASEFLNQNFPELAAKFAAIGVPSTQQLTASAQFGAQMNDNRETLQAARGLREIVDKNKKINDGVIMGMDRAEQLAVDQENKNLGNFKTLEQVSMENQKLMNKAVDAFLKLAPILGETLAVVNRTLGGDLGAVKNSRLVRGMIPGAGKEK